jgi:hypothetical protein
MSPYPRPFLTYLETEQELARLHARIQEQQRLLHQVRLRLPAEVAEQCRAALQAGNQLILFAASPAWASRLRFIAPSRLADIDGADRMRVQVLPDDMPRAPVRAADSPQPISRTAGDLLRALAETMDDRNLGEALQRLADQGR